ncbi:MAG: hypothetical protein IIX43_04730, partial [Bacteroidales bacterium]|nr:hypothetical protein [Bacteroidales bacterium]
SDTRYVLSDVILGEGEENIEVQLGGVQNIEKDVYLYSSEVRDGVPSQTMIGMAEGPRDVNVMMSLSFDMEVNDSEFMKEHVWRTEEIKTPER